MWLLFHHNAKTRSVPDGESFVDKCPECGKRATFHEVELTENVGLFFVDLVGDKQRAFRCGACGDVFDLKDRESSPELEAPPAKSAAELAREARVAEQRRLESERARREAAEAKANQIEDELADLKKRMGR